MATRTREFNSLKPSNQLDTMDSKLPSATLKSEKAKQLLNQARYGKFGLNDPFLAVQRDLPKDTSNEEQIIKGSYDNQLMHLENLIQTQRKSQTRMREQLAAVEKRYHKVTADDVTLCLTSLLPVVQVLNELDDERRKHAIDTAEGDDVTYMLEKERERLKQELEFEKNQNKKMEKELRKASTALESEYSVSAKHKKVALLLIKERKRLVERLMVLQKQTSESELNLEVQKMEAVFEEQLHQWDLEREQLRARLSREEARSGALAQEVEQLRAQLGTNSLGAEHLAEGLERTALKVQHAYRSTPPHTPPEARRQRVLPSEPRLPESRLTGVTPDSAVKSAILKFNKPGEGVSAAAAAGVTPPAGAAALPGSAVYTTPTGTRISVNVAQGASARTSSAGGPRPPVTLPKPFIKKDPSAPQPGDREEGGLAASKYGITISKDKITISNPESSLPSRPSGVQADTSSRKPSQFDLPDVSSISIPDLEFLNTEMNDLQELLVSMVTGTGESSAHSVDSGEPTAVSLQKPLVVPSDGEQRGSPDLPAVTSPGAGEADVPVERVERVERVSESERSDAADFLLTDSQTNRRIIPVEIDINSGAEDTDTSVMSFVVGQIEIHDETTWTDLETRLGDILSAHFRDVTIGVRSRRISRIEPDSEGSSTANLGLSLNSVKFYCLGSHQWSPGTPCELSPLLVSRQDPVSALAVHLFGLDDGCYDALAYELLLPVVTIQNYLRLIDQYRHLVLYGSGGVGKTRLAWRLAHCAALREAAGGRAPEVVSIVVTQDYSRETLLDLLQNHGCLVPYPATVTSSRAPILVFDNISAIDVGTVFGNIFPLFESRGPENHITISTNTNPEPRRYYMSWNCCILVTMDRVKYAAAPRCVLLTVTSRRYTGLDLSLQQRLRLVHLRTDADPVRGLLQRHLLRKLQSVHGGVVPAGDDPVVRVVEYVVSVWQRLALGLEKLGLQTAALGPCSFLACPLEADKPKTTLRWLQHLWNHVVTPAVVVSMTKNTREKASETAQQKMASTALFVLLQRSVVSGCPLSGQEKERYLVGFCGSNDLDIKVHDRKSVREHGSAQSSEHAPNHVLADTTDSPADRPAGDVTRHQRALRSVSAEPAVERTEQGADMRRSLSPGPRDSQGQNVTSSGKDTDGLPRYGLTVTMAGASMPSSGFIHSNPLPNSSNN